LLYRQIVWQAGCFVKSVPRFALKVAENVPKSMLLDVSVLTSGGDREGGFERNRLVRSVNKIAA
jgi:hypothetical protein